VRGVARATEASGSDGVQRAVQSAFHDADTDILAGVCVDVGVVECELMISIVERGRFLARDVIYTSRAYATMSVSVCL